jgi:hypothetical protein
MHREMAKCIVPFAEGPRRPKQIISLGLYRTGSQSLKEALTILGYRDVFHSSALVDNFDKWNGMDAAADANIACLPSYTGHSYNREEWDAYLGPCDALTDVTPFAESLLNAYPEARVILVKRDFDSWVQSFLRTLVSPSSDGMLAWLSGNVFEPLVGLHLSQTVWKMYMGLLGVCDLGKTRDHNILRAGYDRHHANVRRLVPADRLLELDLADLGWEPLCDFLGKEIPDVPFPHLNESRVFRNKFRELHQGMLIAGMLKILTPPVAAGGIGALGIWVAKMRN